MRTTLILFVAAVACTLGGCASIVSKAHYPVTITSTPPGATVVVRDANAREMHKAQTPTTLTLPASAGYFSKSRYTFEFSKEGHASTRAPLLGMVDPWYFGNIIFGGIIGLAIVDPLTGAMWQLDDNVSATLTPVAGAAPAANPQPVVPMPAGAAAADGQPSIPEQLRALKKLWEDGVISAEEYALKRAPLIEQL
jgi:hypothetical protein